MPAEDNPRRAIQNQERSLTDASLRNTGPRKVTSRGAKYWSSGSIPLIAPDVLGDIIAKASDISIVISEDGRILSVLMLSLIHI